MLNNDLPVIVEMPIELWVNNKKNITFMCSPYDLEDLAIGHMITRGIINNMSCIKDIIINNNTNQIFITTNTSNSKQIYTVPEFIVSGTSSVSAFSDAIYKIPNIKNDFSINMEKVVDMAKRMIDEAIIYNSTGGVHGSILCSESNYYLREDIGRHCSVDKAIGAAIKDGIDFSHSFICTTGRISLDMLLKSAVVGIPIVASLKYPSNMGVDLANHYGMTIVSRVLLDKPLIYGYKSRIKVTGYNSTQ